MRAPSHSRCCISVTEPTVLHPTLAQGMLEGAGSIGQSVLRGFKGLISQPVQGAKRQGAVGERLFGEAGSKLLCVRGRSA